MKCRLLAYLTLLGIALLGATPIFAAEFTLVPKGEVWKYLDQGSNQGTAWRAPAFDDRTWPAGPAQLGYGDGGEATVIGYGPNASAKYITTYFRRSFSVSDPAAYKGLTLNLLRDDGAVVYLNGAEVFRSNMPAGAVSYTTLAVAAVGGADESTFYPASISPSLLVAGNNVLAVEVHQANGTSSDVSFDAELIASTGVNLTRGPYLQMGTSTTQVLRWRTSAATDSRVRLGASPASLTIGVDDLAATTEHAVKVIGLAPGTVYYYSVGSATDVLAGGDASHFFVTPPVPGTAEPTRVWVLGDAGTAGPTGVNANQTAVRDAYNTFNGIGYTDLILMLGDNAYDTGTDAEYQNAVFNMYASFLSRSNLWSTIGNHDTAQSISPDVATLPYFNIFTLPAAGQAGGLASGTEKYYSFDFGNIHFVCLDSMTSDRGVNGAMLTWLGKDLAANTRPWLIAFWHHPPYTKGSHNSDTETQLIEMRTNALPILEAYGVDLVLTGHSHSYERSFLLGGHYGLSTTLVGSMIKDGGSGRPGETGAYAKATNPQRAVYAVAGSSGQISGGSLNHPAMFISLNQLGSMVLDVNGSRLDATFLRDDGVVADSFAIVKVAANPAPAPVAPSGLKAAAVSSVQVNLAWTDNSANETGFRIERSTDGTSFAQIAAVGADVKTYSDAGLARAKTYTYRVRATNAGGDSAYSNTASVKTPRR